MEELRDALSNWLNPHLVGEIMLTWGGRVVAALLIFFVGRIAARVLSGWLRNAVGRVGVDETIGRFFASAIYIALLALVVVTAVAALGVPTTSFIAVLGAAGLAIGLALRDSLANFSAGVMLVFFRPFKVGDVIEAAGVSGKVETIGIYDTVIKSSDNRVITVPNSLIYRGTIINSTSEPLRRIDLTIPISYRDDVEQAKGLIHGLLSADTRVLPQPAAEVVIQDLVPTNVNLAVRAWVGTGQYGAARGDLLERIKLTLEAHGMALTHIPPPPPPPPVATRAAGHV